MPRIARQIMLMFTIIVVLYCLIANANQVWIIFSMAAEWLWVKIQDISVNLIANLFWVVLVFLAVRFREKLWQSLRSFFLATEEKQRHEERESNERLYLANISAKIRQDEPKWDTHLYVPLTATESYIHPGFQPEMILISHTLRPLLTNSNADEEDISFVRGKRIDLIDLLRRHERLVVLGEPGSGKTVAMRQLMLLATDEAKKRSASRRRLPVLINMRSYIGVIPDGKPKPILEFVREYIKLEMPRYGYFLAEQLEDYLVEGRLIVLFDGLNEMPPNDYTERIQAIKKFAVEWSRNKFIFTCRTFHHDPLFNIQEIVINPLNERKIDQFARNYLGIRDGQLFIEALKAGDRRVLRDCRTPYFLALAIGLFSRDRSLPQNRADLFSKFIAAMLEAAAIRKSLPVEEARAIIYELLVPLAFTMNEAKLLGTEVDKDWISEKIVGYKDTSLSFAKEAGLLDIAHENRTRFAHHILQEYFAANKLMEQLAEKNARTLTHLNDPWWAETIVLMAGLMPEPEQLIHLYLTKAKQPALGLWLAARCLASSTISAENLAYRKVFESIRSHLAVDNVFRITKLLRALGELGDSESIRLVGQYLYSGNPWIQETALLAIASSPTLEARQELLRFFKTQTPWKKLSVFIQLYVPIEQRPRVLRTVASRLLIIVLFYFLAILFVRGLATFGEDSLVRPFSWFSWTTGLISISCLFILLIGFVRRLSLSIFRLSRPSINFVTSSVVTTLLIFIYEYITSYQDASTLLRLGIIIWQVVVFAFFIEQGVKTIRNYLGNNIDRDRLIQEWAFSWKGILICTHLLFSLFFTFYVLIFRRYVILNMLLVALGSSFPPISRIILGGYLLLGGLFLTLPLPAGVLSIVAQVTNARILTRLRQLDQRAGVTLPVSRQSQDLQFIEQWVRNPLAPVIVRNQAIVTWGHQIETTRALPLLVRLSFEAGISIETLGAVQKAIDEISNRWRRQSHEDSVDTSLAQALLELVDQPDRLTDDARTILLQWINEQSESNDRRIILAVLLQREGKFVEAAEKIGQAVVIEPDNFDLYRSQIAALLKINSYTDAIIIIEALVTAKGKRYRTPNTSPSDLTTLVEGTIFIVILAPLYWLGIRSQSLKELLAHGYNSLAGYLNEKTRSQVGAIERYTHAIRLLPDQAFLYRNRAQCFIKLGRFEEATLDLDKATNLQPQHPYLWLRRFQLHFYKGDLENASAYLEKGILENPLENWYFELGLVLLCMAHVEAAKRAYMLGMRLEPDSTEIRDARRYLQKFAPKDLTADVKVEIENILQMSFF